MIVILLQRQPPWNSFHLLDWFAKSESSYKYQLIIDNVHHYLCVTQKNVHGTVQIQFLVASQRYPYELCIVINVIVNNVISNQTGSDPWVVFERITTVTLVHHKWKITKALFVKKKPRWWLLIVRWYEFRWEHLNENMFIWSYVLCINRKAYLFTKSELLWYWLYIHSILALIHSPGETKFFTWGNLENRHSYLFRFGICLSGNQIWKRVLFVRVILQETGKLSV